MFKIGDLVECINSGEYRNLTQGRQYKVLDVRNNQDSLFVKVANDENDQIEYYSHRFKKVEAEMLPRIVYIDTVNSELNKVVVDYLEKLGMTVNSFLKKDFFRYTYIYTDEFRVEGCKNTTTSCISINQLYEMKLKKPIIVNGHKVEKLENGLKIGCTTLTMEQIEELYKFAKG